MDSSATRVAVPPTPTTSINLRSVQLRSIPFRRPVPATLQHDGAGSGGGGADGEPVLPLMCLIPGSIQPIDPPEIYKLTQTACTLQADEQDGQLVCKETQPGADGPAAPLLERSTELCTAAELVSRLPLREWAGTSTEACCCYGNVRVSQRPGAPTTRNPPTRLPTLHGTHPSSACRKTHACTATESGSSACLPACLPAVAAPHDPN